jgi:hypothetical protein
MLLVGRNSDVALGTQTFVALAIGPYEDSMFELEEQVQSLTPEERTRYICVAGSSGHARTDE